MQRYILSAITAAAMALILATGVAAQQEPENLNDFVFVHDVYEHKVIISAPFGFTQSQRGFDNLGQWADWACDFYKRDAVGPLNERQASSEHCDIINMMTHPQATNPRRPTQEQMEACQVFHLFACALR